MHTACQKSTKNWIQFWKAKEVLYFVCERHLLSDYTLVAALRLLRYEKLKFWCFVFFVNRKLYPRNPKMWSLLIIDLHFMVKLTNFVNFKLKTDIFHEI
jgi:hypothetical protein